MTRRTAADTVAFGDADDVFGDLLDADEIRAGSGKTSKFSAHDVELAGRRIDAAGVVEKISQWRAEDRAGKHPGGRPPMLSNRAVLIVCLMLVLEGSPLWMTEMSNVFHYRLTPDGRTALGIDHIVDSGVDDVDAAAWYSRVGRRLHSIIDT